MESHAFCPTPGVLGQLDSKQTQNGETGDFNYKFAFPATMIS